MTGFDQSQSPRLGQKTTVESTTVTMFNGSEIPEASWDGRMIYRPDRQVIQIYRSVTGAYEDVTGGDLGTLTFVGPTIPVSLHAGDLWFDSSNANALYVAAVPGAADISALGWILAQDSAKAQSTADQKSAVYYQPVAPLPADTPLKPRDVWVDTSSDNQVRIWDGMQWSDSKFSTGALDTQSITLEGLTLLGNLDLRGFQNVFNGEVMLSSGVTDPLQPPLVNAAGWDWVTQNGQNASTGASYGFLPLGLYDNGTSWLYTDSLFDAGNVNSINKTTGVRTVLFTCPTNFGAYGGVVKISTNYYVLGTDSARSSNYWMYIFNSSGVKTGEWQLKDPSNNPIPSSHSCAVGIDGSGNLLVARRSVTNAFTVNVYTTSGVPTVAPGTYDTWAGATITGVLKVPVDTGTARYVVSSSDGMRVFNTSTAARITAEEWVFAGTPLSGVSHDGSIFHTLEGNGATNYVDGTDRVWHYTNLIGEGQWKFSWYDNDGSGLGHAETAPSPARIYSPTKRAKWTVSLPQEPPDDGTTDGADSAYIYYQAPGTTGFIQQTLLTAAPWAHTYSSFSGAGATPKLSSEFLGRESTSFGVFYTSPNPTSGFPVFEVNGSGQGVAGPYGWTDDGGYANDTGWVPITLGASYKAGSTVVPAVRKVDKLIKFQGSISPNSGNYSTATNVNVGTVAAGLRPPSTKTFSLPIAAAAGSQSTYRLQVDSAGVMSISPSSVATATVVLDPVQYWDD
jgi:hypothetical protein